MTPAQQHLITQFFTSRGVDESKLATLSSPALHFVNSPTRRHSFTRELTEALAQVEAMREAARVGVAASPIHDHSSEEVTTA
jgi:hypothetical protein